MPSIFLQLGIEKSQNEAATNDSLRTERSMQFFEIKEDRSRQAPYQPERVTPLLHFFSQFSKIVVISLYFALLMLVFVWFVCGLPKKAPQDASVKDKCPDTWWIFLCLTYGFIFFTTDQYAPSLPQMGVDLAGSQSLMSATVQLNFVTKSAIWLHKKYTHGELRLSTGQHADFARETKDWIDHLKPHEFFCGSLSLLAMASFCCGCAPNINWFIASRFLQGLGESVEPVVFAACRDYFSKPEERLKVIAYVQLIGIMGQIVAPIFGGFLSSLFDWRLSFFCLALIWGGFATYAARYMVESCPDACEHEGGNYWKGLRRILAPGVVCLLLTEACVIVPFEVFNANIGYVAQVSYGQSSIITAVILLAWAIADALGVVVLQCFQSSMAVLQLGRIVMAMVAVAGIISMFLGVFAEYLWSYVTASMLHSLLVAAALVPLNVLYFEPLEDCAGVAASFEIFAKYVPPCLYSMLCTQSLIHSGVKSYMNLQSVTRCVLENLRPQVFC
eukprot:Skav207924  [mRNA]  locus=scaffold1441:24748:29616:+ [translate_table: standard]